MTVNSDTQDNGTEAGASFSTVIKKESISSYQDLPALIEKETSVQVRQSGGLGSFSSASLRGASSNQVMVFLNGIPLNDSAGSSVDLSSIPYSQISSVEIYRGTTPAVFGRTGMGGAINIKTLKVDKKFDASVTTAYSSFNTFKFAPTLSQKVDRFDYLINMEYLSSKNNFTFTNNNGTSFNPNDDRVDQRNNSQFWHANLLAETGYDISKNVRLELTEQYFDKDQHLPNQNNSPLTKATLSTQRNIASLKLNYFNSSSRLDYTYKSEYYDDKTGTLSLLKQYDRYITNNYGYNQVLESVNKYNIFDFVFDFHREQYAVRDLLMTKSSSDSSRNNYTTSAEDKVILFNEALMIIPALTYEYYGTYVGTTAKNYYNGYLNPKIGLKYQIISNTVELKSNIARYTREPSFFELIGDRGYFIGNDTLKAERGTNFDIGSEFKVYDDGSTAIQKIKLEVAYFRNKVTDVISYVYDSSGIGHAVNISDSIISGVETTFTMDLLKYFSISSNYTWQNPINKSGVPLYNNKKLPGRFENSASAKLEGRYNIFKIYYELLYASGLFYDSANLLAAPVKREHNVGLTLVPGKFTITGEVKNIGDDHYQDFNGFPQPGRSYWLTAKFDY